MNLIKKLFLPIASIVAFVSTNHAMEKINNKYFYTEYEKRTPTAELIKKYTATPEYMARVNDENSKSKESLWKRPFITKSRNAVSRVRGSLLIRECAQEFGLDAVSAPTKYFKTKEDGSLLKVGDEEYVVVPFIKNNSAPFSLKQIQQLCKLIKKTGYADIKEPNIFNTAEGIAYLLDTEYRSFYVPGNIDCCQEYDLVTFYERTEIQLPMEANAREWLLQKIEKQKRKDLIHKK